MCLGSRDTGYDKDVLSSLLSAQALENRRLERKRKQVDREEKEERAERMQRSMIYDDGTEGGDDSREGGNDRQRRG